MHAQYFVHKAHFFHMTQVVYFVCAYLIAVYYIAGLSLLQQRMAVKSSQFWQQKAKDLTLLVRFHTRILKSSGMDLLALFIRLSYARVVTSLPLRKSSRTSASRFPALSPDLIT